MVLLTIGELAKRVGVSVETVRFYQRKGLLPEPPRRLGKARLYSLEVLAQLRFIRRAKGLDFSLKEIAELLKWRRLQREGREAPRSETCVAIHQRLADAIATMEAKRRVLKLKQRALMHILAACEGKKPIRSCAALAALEE